MEENECCYTCKQYRRVEVDGEIVDGKKAGGCRLHGGLIGMGIPSKAKLSPMSHKCIHWRNKNWRADNGRESK